MRLVGIYHTFCAIIATCFSRVLWCLYLAPSKKTSTELKTMDWQQPPR